MLVESPPYSAHYQGYDISGTYYDYTIISSSTVAGLVISDSLDIRNGGTATNITLSGGFETLEGLTYVTPYNGPRPKAPTSSSTGITLYSTLAAEPPIPEHYS